MAQQPTTAGSAALAPDETPNYLSHDQIIRVLIGILAGVFLGALDQSIVGTALPRITSDLGGLDYLSWVVTAYLLTATASTPLWGKISDLYGRRLIFQISIGIFIIGSMLCGISGEVLGSGKGGIIQLIIFRALQGIGGGGLFSLGLAIIGDIVPPRERGRYGGYFGAVFAVSSVAGPLLGGFFTDGPGWRWIFYINVPIGILAFWITSRNLTMPRVRREAVVDWAGAGLTVASVTSLLLYLNWAGTHFGWGAWQGLVLVALAVILAIAFIFVELRAPEPILPMHLFRGNVFAIGNLYTVFMGVSMFGALIFLPVYLQAVKGMTATESGLALIPAVAGIMSTAIGSGILITKTGRYKIYPIVGAIVLFVALAAMTQIGVGTPYWQVAIMMFLFGAGLGFTMQTITTAIQNAVSMRDLGAASAANTFFRQLGGAIGTAIFGAILSSHLASYIADEFAKHPDAAQQAQAGGGGVDTNNVQAIQQLPEPIKGFVLTAFSHAIDDIFLWSLPFVLIAFVVAFFLKEIPLRETMSPEAMVAPEGETETGDQRPSTTPAMAGR